MGEDKAAEELHYPIIHAKSGEVLEKNRIDVCLAKLFSRFDQRRKQISIPHPFPLLPAAMGANTGHKKSHFFNNKAKTHDKMVQQGYQEASNANILTPEIKTNKLLDAFLRFERTDDLRESDLRDARRARWILLYGLLQVLASITVDTPGLFSTKGAEYFLCPRLKGAPSWKTVDEEVFDEASSRDSYCWQCAESWKKN